MSKFCCHLNIKKKKNCQMKIFCYYHQQHHHHRWKYFWLLLTLINWSHYLRSLFNLLCLSPNSISCYKTFYFILSSHIYDQQNLSIYPSNRVNTLKITLSQKFSTVACSVVVFIITISTALTIMIVIAHCACLLCACVSSFPLFYCKTW